MHLSSSSALGDEPTRDLGDDRLDRASAVERFAAQINTLTSIEKSAVTAVISPWGGGKTSFLNATSEMLEASGSWNVVWFNPWLFQDEPALQEGFFQELSTVLPAETGWAKARKSLATVAKRVAPFGSLGSLVGVDVSAALTSAGEALSPPQSLSNILAQIDSEFAKLEKHTLIILDDLDRLAPSELLLALKLIRLVGRLTNVYYVLSYDERSLLEILSQTEAIGGGSPRRGIDYLEKIVQLRVDVPPIRRAQVDEWTDEGFAALASHLPSLNTTDVARFYRAYNVHIADRLNSPRSIKRLFTHLTLTLPNLVGEVNIADYAILTWLRTNEPLVWDAIRPLKSALTSPHPNSEGAEQTEISRDALRDLLRNNRVSEAHVEGIGRVLAVVFPNVAQEWFPHLEHDDPVDAGVANPDYFDRYFADGVPAEDISDLLVISAYSTLGRSLNSSQPLDDLYSKNGQGLLRKLARVIEQHPNPEAPLLPWLAQAYISPSEEAVLSRSRRLLIEVAVSAVEVIPYGRWGELGSSDGRNAAYLHLLCQALADLERQDAETMSPERAPALVQLADSVNDAIARFFEQTYAGGSVLAHPDLVDLLKRWADLDPKRYRSWLKSRLSPVGDWMILEYATNFVPRIIRLSSAAERHRIGDIRPADLARYVDVDKLREEVQPLTATPPVDADPWNQIVDTPDNRRKKVIEAMK